MYEIHNFHFFCWICSGLVPAVVTFRFSSTNTTQILQTRKQMEYDNNEH